MNFCCFGDDKSVLIAIERGFGEIFLLESDLARLDVLYVGLTIVSAGAF